MRCSTGPIRYRQALSDCEAVASVGSKEYSHDNAPAKAVKLLVQGRAHPLARNLGRTSTPPVVATAEWVHWVGTIRPHSVIGMRTPAEHEAAWVADGSQNSQEQSQPATTGTR